MGDNSTLPAVGDVIRGIDKSGKKTQVVAIDVGGAGTEDLVTGALPIKGRAFTTTASLTVTSGAYSVGDVVGGLITITGASSANGKRSIINSVSLAGVVAIEYELWFFNSDIATPAADNAAFSLAAGDGLKFLGVVPITTSDYFSAQNSFNNASVRSVGLEFATGGATTSVFAYLKTTVVTSPGTTILYLTVAGEHID